MVAAAKPKLQKTVKVQIRSKVSGGGVGGVSGSRTLDNCATLNDL